MKSISSVVALCLVLWCASLASASPLDRSLKQTCSPPVSPAVQAIRDASDSIASALNAAVREALRAVDVAASSVTFGQTMTAVYAKLIVKHIWITSVLGVSACAPGPNYVGVTRLTISQATSRRFAQSTNAAARAAALCLAEIVNSAAVTAIQKTSLCQICASNSEDRILLALEASGFTQTLATAFSFVFVAIRDANPAAACLGA